MSDAWLFALVVLAVYRMAYLIAEDEGPFSVFKRLRESVEPNPNQRSWIGRGVRCPVCVSFWLALFAAPFMPGVFALNWLALAGASLALIRVAR